MDDEEMVEVSELRFIDPLSGEEVVFPDQAALQVEVKRRFDKGLYPPKFIPVPVPAPDPSGEGGE